MTIQLGDATSGGFISSALKATELTEGISSLHALKHRVSGGSTQAEEFAKDNKY